MSIPIWLKGWFVGMNGNQNLDHNDGEIDQKIVINPLLSRTHLEQHYDPARLGFGIRFLFYFCRFLLVSMAIVFTAVGVYYTTGWFAKRGVEAQGVLQIIVALPMVILAGGVFSLGMAILNGLVFGPFPRLTGPGLNPNPSSETAIPIVEYGSPENQNEINNAGPQKGSWAGRKEIIRNILIILLVAGGAFIFWQYLLPVFSYDIRKSRMEAAIVKIFESKFPGQPERPKVELTQEIDFGIWKGTVKIGDMTYQLKAIKNKRDISIEYKPLVD